MNKKEWSWLDYYKYKGTYKIKGNLYSRAQFKNFMRKKELRLMTWQQLNNWKEWRKITRTITTHYYLCFECEKEKCEQIKKYNTLYYVPQYFRPYDYNLIDPFMCGACLKKEIAKYNKLNKQEIKQVMKYWKELKLIV